MDFMQEAIKEGVKGMRAKHGGPFGALIIRHGKIVARAHNMVLKTNDPTAHAEVLAIRAASKKLKKFDLSDCEIYTSCEPCPMCFSAIHWARIPKVYYAATMFDAKRAGFKELLISAEKMKWAGESDIELKKVECGLTCIAPFTEFVEKKIQPY